MGGVRKIWATVIVADAAAIAVLAFVMLRYESTAALIGLTGCAVALIFISNASRQITAAPAAMVVTTMIGLGWSAAGYRFGLIFLAVGVPGGLVLFLRWRRRRRLEADGIEAVGRILAIRDTGMQINNRSVVRVRMSVTATGGAPFEASKFVPVARYSALSVGDRLPLLLDPANRTRLMVRSRR